MEWEYLSEVEEKVDEIRNKALVKVHAINPDIYVVVDNRTLDDYCEKQWDYPGQWYCFFRLPNDVRSEDELIDKIVKETLASFKNH